MQKKQKNVRKKHENFMKYFAYIRLIKSSCLAKELKQLFMELPMVAIDEYNDIMPTPRMKSSCMFSTPIDTEAFNPEGELRLNKELF